VEPSRRPGFAVWITGLPGSGKSTIAAEVKAQLCARGADIAVLESDALRAILTPQPHYSEEERDHFYRQMVYIGLLLIEHGVPVIFDATANLRIYRVRARKQIHRFLEVYVDCPLSTCMERDPKGIYRQAREGAAGSVPGLQAPYEPPETPDLIVKGDRETAEAAAGRLIALLADKDYISPPSTNYCAK
jgi:adenylylsulfate kinase